jgi:hypothetical protein
MKDTQRQGETGLFTTILSHLDLAERNEEFRHSFFTIIDEAAATCGDRMALSVLHLGIANRSLTLDKTDLKGFADFLIHGPWMLDQLEQIARAKTATLRFVDEIEVYLAYPVKLKERLELQIDVKEMLYFTHLTQEKQKLLDKDFLGEVKTLVHFGDNIMNKKLLDIYSDYLITQNGYATATGLSRMLDGLISHDKITRFLNGKESSSKELWEYVKPKIRKIEDASGGVLILDDSIEEKPYTDENDIISWHYSHAKNRCVKGINILSCLVRYGDTALPIGYELIRKDVSFCEIKTRKEKRKASISKNEIFRDLIDQAKKNEIQFDYVLADNWFGSKKNMEFIHYDMKKKFIIGIKSNRSVCCVEEEKKGQYQNLRALSLKDGEKRIVSLKDCAFSVALITKIFKNEDGSTGTLYLVTNDLESSADQIYEVYKKRWRIEEYHKSIKQNASLEKSPTKVARSQRNHIFASIVAYCKLEFLKLKTCLNHFALKYKLILKANQIAFWELKKMQGEPMFA